MEIKSIVQDFLIEAKMMAKISKFTGLYELVVSPPHYDVYIIDLDTEENGLEVGKKLMEKMEEYFKDMGCEYISVDVFAYNGRGINFYKKMGYDGVFITNHFLDGNVNIDIDSEMKKGCLPQR